MKGQQTTRRRASSGTLLLGLACYILLAALLLLLAGAMINTYRERNRGVEAFGAMAPDPSPAPWGVNVALEQYSREEAQHALSVARQAGFHWIRQEFPWDAMQPEAGRHFWEPWDERVALAREQGLSIVAVLNRSPAWARAEIDQDNPLAPPHNPQDLAAWAAILAGRYGDHIAAYQIWDQPNIWPHWGARDADPAAYTRLLAATHQAIKATAPQARVISAGLAPNAETGGRNLSDALYLAGMYDAGAAPYFHVLGAKPYGFWSGPGDRRVHPDVLNYARLILLREEMRRRGDAHKPIWAVEMGWNALPQGWQGAPSPWGTDSREKQAERTLDALSRARAEWPWLEVMVLQHLQPNAPQDDPIWGFALLDRQGQPRPLYPQISAYIHTPASSPLPYTPPSGRLAAALLTLGLGLAVIAWRGYVHLRQLPLGRWWRRGSEAFLALGDAQQAAVVGLALLALITSPWEGLALLALWAILAMSYLRLEWTLLYAVLLAPLAPLQRAFWDKSFSYIEILTLVALSAWALQAWSQNQGSLGKAVSRVKRLAANGDWRGLGGAWCFFLAVAALSLAFSRHLGVSLREFRVIVLEPAAFYLLLTRYPFRFGPGQAQVRGFLRHLLDALVLAGVLLAMHGLAQYLGGGDVIVTEGVRRIRGIYGSPNNLSLVLGRALPLALAVALWGQTRQRRVLYGLGTAIMVSCLFLTFSRGAWILGIPAALFFLGIMRGRRATLIILGAVALGLLLLLPLAGTQRIASLLDPETGTALFRLSLWKSSLAMIRDHPLTGVGLDNFLYYYQEYILSEAAAEPNLSHPHNLVLDFWTRLGLGGLAALSWVLASFFRRGLALWKRLPQGDERAMALGLMASVVNMVAHGMVDNSYFVIELAFIFALTTGWIQRLAANKEGNP